MPEWLLVAIGILAGLVVVIGVFYIVNTPRPLGRKRSWLADRSDLPEQDSHPHNIGGWPPDT